MSDDTHTDCGSVSYGVELFRIQDTLRATRPLFCDWMEEDQSCYAASQSEQGEMSAWLKTCLGFADMLIDMGVRDQALLLDFLRKAGAWPLFERTIIGRLLSPHGSLARADTARPKED